MLCPYAAPTYYGLFYANLTPAKRPLYASHRNDTKCYIGGLRPAAVSERPRCIRRSSSPARRAGCGTRAVPLPIRAVQSATLAARRSSCISVNHGVYLCRNLRDKMSAFQHLAFVANRLPGQHCEANSEWQRICRVGLNVPTAADIPAAAAILDRMSAFAPRRGDLERPPGAQSKHRCHMHTTSFHRADIRDTPWRTTDPHGIGGPARDRRQVPASTTRLTPPSAASHVHAPQT
jgi:hypothetical protein